jgi:type II secretory pathway pseudopilin PulG
MKVIELGAVVVLVGVIGGGALIGVRGCASSFGIDKASAEQNARQYAGELGVEVAGLSCTGVDTDGDGYVSCTIRGRDGSLTPIECAGRLTLNSGCRVARVIPIGVRRGVQVNP